MTPDEAFDRIDQARLSRARSLSNTKQKFTSNLFGVDTSNIASQSVVVLCYAHWEGFYADCVKTYIDFLVARGQRVRETNWLFMVGVLDGAFQSLVDRNASWEAKLDFVESLETRLDTDFSGFNRTCVKPRSNLDADQIALNGRILGIQFEQVHHDRLRINRQLVKWRHEVAHGNEPDLSDVNIVDHCNLTISLLLHIADKFQEKIVSHL
ncbi:hypothetical protein HK107_11210 [Parvularcula sp. ZS-1/3]|jgi:hypothetical protein|uniref:MAE-28990/MAE-18760-like HEPN domain-containing protein n=1 Tax=Parvularcula mediterranea TaxID=2732508 RepID=A0A7Y3RNM5_9PROT|nr:MAE_28990/MAE_18760 family HEPN-like nuclease [Parvularcula mediterranea]NNU16886.1 hypothetical protein [Parvularcula mediterranea]